MKKCKHASKYNGIKKPFCRFSKDGPCEICKEKFQKLCNHPNEYLSKKDGTIICLRCDSDLGMSIELLWNFVLELKREILEIKSDIRPEYD